MKKKHGWVIAVKQGLYPENKVLRTGLVALSLQTGGCYECYGYDSCDGKPQRE